MKTCNFENENSSSTWIGFYSDSSDQSSQDSLPTDISSRCGEFAPSKIKSLTHDFAKFSTINQWCLLIEPGLNATFDLTDNQTKMYKWLAHSSTKNECLTLVGQRSSLVQSALTQVYVKSGEGAETEALKITFDFIESHLAQGDTEKIDEFLATFEPKRVKRIISVGVVRSTFRARSVLKEWNDCLVRVAVILNENNQSPSKYLRGLNPTHGTYLLAKANSV